MGEQKKEQERAMEKLDAALKNVIERFQSPMDPKAEQE